MMVRNPAKGALRTAKSPWPWTVSATLARVAGDFAGLPRMPAILARPDGQDAAFPLGPAGGGAAGTVTVTGPPAELLAWLIGRDSGAGLGTAGGAALPVLPPWR